MDIDLAGQFLSVDVLKVLRSEIYHLDRFITLPEDDLSELYETVYEGMVGLIGNTGFPFDIILETQKTHYISDFINRCVRFVKIEFHLDEDQLRWGAQAMLPLTLDRERTVKADYVVYGEKDEGKKYYLAVVECKTSACDDAAKQTIGYLKSAFDLNRDGRTVYGICTNVRRIRFMSYNPNHTDHESYKGFRVTEDFCFLFPRMTIDDDYKQLWKDRHTKPIDIFFAIIAKLLELPPCNRF